MKGKIKIIVSLLAISLIALTVASGQEKKSEQKVKIIINDGSGTKVIVDTLITDGHLQDSIRLKDGKVIFIGHQGDESGMKHSGDNEHMYVIASSDDNVKHGETKTITVVTSDSSIVSHSDGDEKVIIVSKASPGHSNGTVQYKVISGDSHGEGKSDDKVFYISKAGSSGKEKNESVKVYVNEDDNESNEYSTRSIIAKDGLVVTVEGNDEAKVKELVKEIQQKMGVKPPASEKNETVNTGTKKTTRK
jgi:hypothetical protein